MSTLPAGWAATKLGDIGEWSSGGTPSRKVPAYFGGTIPWVKTGDLRHQVIDQVEETITETGLANSAAKLFPPGSLLLAMYGATIGQTGVLNFEAATNQACAALLPNGSTAEILPYVWRYVIAEQENLKSVGQGGAQPNISQTIIKEYPIRIAPLAEQQRIVAKIDSLSGKIKRSRDHLDHLPKLAQKYKQAILALAFRGDLTREWRDNHPAEAPNFEGKHIAQRVGELGELPGTWRWTAMQDVASITGGLTKNAKRATLLPRAPYLRVANVYANELRLDDIAQIGCSSQELAKTRLRKGDLLIVEGNGSIDQIGRVALWNDEISGCSHQNHIIRGRPGPDLIPDYALHWLLSPNGRKAIERVASSSSGLHTLSISKVEGLPIPICVPDEQLEVVRRINAALSWINRLVSEATQARRLIDHVDQAVLTKAFLGQLVPQDPSDEPASVLLERIRAERDEGSAKPRKRAKTRKR